MKYCKKSVREACTSDREIIKKIYDRMLETRRPAEVVYRPFTVFDEVDMVNHPGANLAAFYPDFEEGDYAFIAADMDGIFESELVYNVGGCKCAKVYFNGEEQKLVPAPNNTLDANVTLKKGKNRAITQITAENGSFEGYVNVLVPKLRCGADDYVYNTKQYTIADGFRGQEGIAISRLYKKDETLPEPTMEGIDWAFPVKPAQTEKKTFDFNSLCTVGCAAFVYTFVRGEVLISHRSPMKVYSDGEVLYSAADGRFEKCFSEYTPLLIKSVKNDNEWGFFVEKASEDCLPVIETDECSDLHWIWIGPFGREGDTIDTPYAPEKNIFFNEPYPSACAGSVYWRFYRKNTYLRQYLETTFYGQWFYAMMVGLHGLHRAADKLGDESFYKYFTGAMELICKHRDFGKYDRALFGWTSYMAKASRLEDLDSVGTIGMNVAEYYLMTGDLRAKGMMNFLADRMLHYVPRFSDGTFYRVKTMWTDDMYMCLPFLARLGAISGEQRYFDEIYTQITGFYKRLFMHDEHIYSHIYFPQEDFANHVPWCRGNGWVLLALSEVLLLMPENYENRDKILEIFKEFAKGVLSFRDKKEGIWHQVINNPESYTEASGSAMFIIALARGIRMGWIKNEYTRDVLDAWEALTENCVDDCGNVYGVCMGSGCNKEEKYYLQLDTIVNDDHGMGIVLEAGVEIMNLKEM